MQAFRAAMVTGAFRLPATVTVAVDRETALRYYPRLDDRIENVQSTASKETQMSRRVEMNNMELARLCADRDALRTRL